MLISEINYCKKKKKTRASCSSSTVLALLLYSFKYESRLCLHRQKFLSWTGERVQIYHPNQGHCFWNWLKMAIVFYFLSHSKYE